MDRKAFEKAVDLKEDEVMPCVSPIGYPAEKMSFREAMMRKGVKADSRRDFEKVFFHDSFSEPLKKENAGDIGDVLELVRIAPSAVNRQPWRIVLADGKAHFYKIGTADSDYDIQKIDMGIAICHFMEVLKKKGFEAELVQSDPGSDEPGMTYIASCIW